jgi:hypothetical protein
MADFTAITVDDREDTPVEHVFTPASRPSGDSVLFKEAGVVPLGDSTVNARVTRLPDGSYRCRLTLKVPNLGTRVADGITSYELLDSGFGEAVFRFAATSTEQSRKNVVGLLANMLAASVTPVNDAFTKVEAW